MKRNKLFLLGLFVVFAAVLSLSLVSSTFAKYTSNGVATDTARVAKWGVVVTAETFADDQLEADLTTTETEISAGGTADLLAPGTGIHFASVAISGTPEVAVRVTYTAELTLTDWTLKDGTTEYCPLIFVINGVHHSMEGHSLTQVSDYEAKIEELIAAYSKEYAANTDLGTKSAEELTVSCYWAYSTSKANDLKDTELADTTTVPSVELEITCTVTQID